ncbi:hypothetical protein BDV25DRAFT_28739 [Aspergillus avenaceus]|uniref:Copper-fist domain-containing protein n=1 Tax=Aspergillus avenaceus TaxID=36643 RepID=A0A5N6TMW4_ASPAV|nr:hypothetical protein BDV25DRAFT_28739 [Aspergillus avenaceus]
MPLDEEGAKWSCEPCIRGHRSSKCQHFDRLMMKVPKAGRPLAKCPHPKGTCSCQKLYAFMIRIPKGSTCLCRPVYQVPVDPNDSAPSTSSTPIATISSPAPGKIQKSTKKQVKTPPENLAKALNAIPEFGKQNLENGMSNSLSPYIPSTPGATVPHNDMPHGLGLAAVPSPHQAMEGEDSKPQVSSCCSRKPQPPVQAQPQSSCCKKSESPIPAQNGHSAEPRTNGLSPPFPQSLNKPSYTPISTPQVSPWSDFPADQNQYIQPFISHQTTSAQPDLFPQYMSHATPGAGIAFQQSNSINNPVFAQSHMPQVISNDGYSAGFADSTALNGNSAHDCSCGDNCQCLGCASHPFNNTTRQHVQEMGLLVAFDGEDQTLGTMNGYQRSPLHGNNTNATPLEYPYPSFSHLLNNGTQPMMMQSYSEQPSTISNGYSSPPKAYLPEQQLMEPSQYYTLEYPVGLPSGCSDVTGSCQCGNDCNCVGCLTHSGHNGVSLEPVTAENNNLSSITTATSPELPEIGTSEAQPLNGVSGPFSSPIL